MKKTFNVNGICFEQEHYMVNLESRLIQIKELVDGGKYFVINRGRQYGKTTILWALREYLQQEYVVLFMDFQQMSTASFQDEYTFTNAFLRSLLRMIRNKRMKIAGLDEGSIRAMEQASERNGMDLQEMFEHLSVLCDMAQKPVVLVIDEVDHASNNQVFLDFLSQLRALYLARKIQPAFQSVILAGVYDIKNLKQKIRPDGEHRYNSPWNIAADFDVDMNFSIQDIAGMIREYEKDFHTGMNVLDIAGLIFEYTDGYPYMVSRICQIMDKQLTGSSRFPDRSCVWTREGVVEAVRSFISMPSTLFDDMTKKISDFPELKNMMKEILFRGRRYAYEEENPFINLGIMFGFLKNVDHTVMAANRIFETKLYNIFLSEEETEDLDPHAEQYEKNQFINNGHLDMRMVLNKFVEHFEDVYGDCSERFLEENGRRFFLLYLRPIINGTGNYYIEARTRNQRRTDVIVDYRGEQFVIELKIWHGEEYHKRGEQQLFEYLQFYHKEKGYLISFNFNKKKQTGVRSLEYQGKEIVEAVL